MSMPKNVHGNIEKRETSKLQEAISDITLNPLIQQILEKRFGRNASVPTDALFKVIQSMGFWWSDEQQKWLYVGIEPTEELKPDLEAPPIGMEFQADEFNIVRWKRTGPTEYMAWIKRDAHYDKGKLVAKYFATGATQPEAVGRLYLNHGKQVQQAIYHFHNRVMYTPAGELEVGQVVSLASEHWVQIKGIARDDVGNPVEIFFTDRTSLRFRPGTDDAFWWQVGNEDYLNA